MVGKGAGPERAEKEVEKKVADCEKVRVHWPNRVGKEGACWDVEECLTWNRNVHSKSNSRFQCFDPQLHPFLLSENKHDNVIMISTIAKA